MSREVALPPVALAGTAEAPVVVETTSAATAACSSA